MTPPDPPFDDPNVAAAFAAFPEPERAGLMRLRALIFETAEALDVGALEETLKWGQPAYLTPETKAGTTIRLGRPKTGGFAVYAHCQTTVIPEFRSLFPDDFTYEGNRAIWLTAEDALPEEKLSMLISAALTYHR